MKMSSCDIQNNEIGILLYQSEAEQIQEAIKLILKYDDYINDPKHTIIPQTELAMRGSYGVAKEGGHELFLAAVAPAGGRFVL